MRKRSRKERTRKAVGPLMQAFVNAALNEFQFLVEEYGFECEPVDPASFHPLEWHIHYRTDKIGIVLIYDVGSVPTVAVYDIEGVSHLWRPWGSGYNIDDLITLRCPETKLNDFDPFKISDDEFRQIFRHYATALKEYGSDVLKGDRSAFPELTRIKRRRRR